MLSSVAPRPGFRARDRFRGLVGRHLAKELVAAEAVAMDMERAVMDMEAALFRG
jgi:hypothetical protein